MSVHLKFKSKNGLDCNSQPITNLSMNSSPTSNDAAIVGYVNGKVSYDIAGGIAFASETSINPTTSLAATRNTCYGLSYNP